MKQLTDAILYVPDYPALVTHLAAEHPDMLVRDEAGEIAQPPVVTGFARTPAVTTADGSALLVYARLRPDEVDAWRGMPGVEVLAEAPFQGEGTAQAVYDQVFVVTTALAKYNSVYDRTPREVEGMEDVTLSADPAFDEATTVGMSVNGSFTTTTMVGTAVITVSEGATVEVPTHPDRVTETARAPGTQAPPERFGVLAGA